VPGDALLGSAIASTQRVQGTEQQLSHTAMPVCGRSQRYRVERRGGVLSTVSGTTSLNAPRSNSSNCTPAILNAASIRARVSSLGRTAAISMR